MEPVESDVVEIEDVDGVAVWAEEKLITKISAIAAISNPPIIPIKICFIIFVMSLMLGLPRKHLVIRSLEI